MRNRLKTVLLITSAAMLASMPAGADAAKKKSSYGVKGTSQMAGSTGLFGQTYTLVSSDGFGPINFTLVSAEYSVEPMNMAVGSFYAPKAGEKLLVIHYRFKNPNSSGLYYSSRPLFQAVDANNNTIQDSGYQRRLSEKAMVADTMDPGQGIDDLVTYIVVPSDLKVPKLILELGRAGSSEKVMRYSLGSGVNKVKPIPAPYADPSDPTGATALASIPATIGSTYHAGMFDISLASVQLVPGPLGSHTADDGKQFLAATVTATNKGWTQIYFNGTIVPTLVTDDDKITDNFALKANHDDDFEGRQVDPGETVTQRIVLQVPKDASLKTLSLAEAEDNSGGLSKAFVYDVSGVK